jgi:hypothetical protein
MARDRALILGLTTSIAHNRPYDLALSSFVDFFGNSPYLLRIGGVGEAGHHRPVRAAKGENRRGRKDRQ